MRTKSFNTPDVQAILSGQKTMFREVIKPQPTDYKYCGIVGSIYHFERRIMNNWLEYINAKPRFRQGDIIAVKESWGLNYFSSANFWHFKEGINVDKIDIVYKADDPTRDTEFLLDNCFKSPVTMPREAHRIFLEVVSVKVERLQDISRIGAINEIGKTFESTSNSTCYIANKIRYNNPVSAFQALHLDQWQRNEWVFVYEFRRVEKP